MMNLATGGTPFITRPVGARRSPTPVPSHEATGKVGPSERKFWMKHDAPMPWGKTNNKPLFGVWLTNVDHMIYNMESQAKSCSLSIPKVL